MSHGNFGSTEANDFRATSARYFHHVSWWLRGRAIAPRPNAKVSPAKFGDALATEYMIGVENAGVLTCGPSSPAAPMMEQLIERLYPSDPTLFGKWAPVIAVLEAPNDLNSRFLGIVTPTDIHSKWKKWYGQESTIEPDISYPNPDFATCRDTVREAYTKMGSILTGIPIVDPRNR